MSYKYISVVLLSLISSAVWAHAFPTQESPGANQVISGRSTNVSVTFDSQIEPVFSSVRVMDASNRQVSRGKGSVSGQTLRTQASGLHPGEYQVNWSVVSIDGHETQGNYTFSVK